MRRAITFYVTKADEERIEEMTLPGWIAHKISGGEYVDGCSSYGGAERRALCATAVEAQQLITDGLMPRATAARIRDRALEALGVRGDAAIRVLRGEIV